MKKIRKKGTKLLTMLVVLTMIFSLFPATGVLANTVNNVKVIAYSVTPSGGNYTTSILHEGTYNVSSGSYSATTNNYMGLDANLTTSAACVFDAWYLAAGALGFDESDCSTNVSAGNVYVAKFDNRDSSTYGLANSGWMFTVNDEIPVDANGVGYDAAHAALQSGDVVSIFYVTDYTKTKYLYFDETGATTSGQKILADGADDETLYLKLMEYSLNMSDKYVTPKSGAAAGISTTGDSSSIAEIGSTGVYTVGVTSTSVTGIKTAAGQTYSATAQLIPAYYPIDSTYTIAIGAAKTALNAVITAYADEEAAQSSYTAASWNPFDAAYDDAVAVYNNGSATVNQVLSATNRLKRLGADLIRVNDARLNYLGVSYPFTYTPAFSPDTHTYTYDNGWLTSETYQLGFINPSTTITNATISGSGGSISYDNGADTVSPSGMTTGNYTITIYLSCGTGTENYTINISKPNPDGLPNAVIGYLVAPSQYATGTSYGSISSDDANTLTPTPPAYVKTLASGGLVSIGGFGGYIVYEYSTPLVDSPNNPYGVDFIVYGNAFVSGSGTWAEPGIVQVAENIGGPWYTIAGSEHYSATSEPVPQIYWKMNGTTVRYSLDDGSTWTDFKTNAAEWWPEYAAPENYGATSNHNDFTSHVPMFDADDLKFANLVKLADNVTYQFGYCDVHANGTVTRTAANPYTATYQTAVGDGIDLAWAVDSDGNPLTNLSTRQFKYVRIYTGVLENAGAFGEVSTEVTAVKVASPAGSPVGTTSAPTALTVGGADHLSDLEGGIPDTPIYIPEDTPTTVSVTATSGYAVFVNNAKGTTTSSQSYTLAEGEQQVVRVIVQNGTAQPYIAYLLLEGVS
ncbi:MAG TPA: hypothetical protein VN622_05540 [Clostridia bacterium]|nr:hypothetical protein [Clostridia bacterium]